MQAGVIAWECVNYTQDRLRCEQDLLRLATSSTFLRPLKLSVTNITSTIRVTIIARTKCVGLLIYIYVFIYIMWDMCYSSLVLSSSIYFFSYFHITTFTMVHWLMIVDGHASAFTKHWYCGHKSQVYYTCGLNNSLRSSDAYMRR